MWNNFYRTPTECWQKTSDFKKRQANLHTSRLRERRNEKENRQGNWDGICASGRELWRRKSIHTLRNPLTSGAGGSFRTSGERAAAGVQPAKCREFCRDQCWQHPQPEMLVYLPSEAGGGWCWDSGSEARPHEDSLRAQVQPSCPGNSLDSPERQACGQGLCDSMHSQPAGRAFTGTRGGLSCSSDPGGGHDSCPTPPRLWAGTGHRPHFLGSLCRRRHRGICALGSIPLGKRRPCPRL